MSKKPRSHLKWKTGKNCDQIHFVEVSFEDYFGTKIIFFFEELVVEKGNSSSNGDDVWRLSGISPFRGWHSICLYHSSNLSDLPHTQLPCQIQARCWDKAPFVVQNVLRFFLCRLPAFSSVNVEWLLDQHMVQLFSMRGNLYRGGGGEHTQKEKKQIFLLSDQSNIKKVLFYALFRMQHKLLSLSTSSVDNISIIFYPLK